MSVLKDILDKIEEIQTLRETGNDVDDKDSLTALAEHIINNPDFIDMLKHLAERATFNCTECLGTGLVRCEDCNGRGWFGYSEWTITSYCERCNRSGSIRCKSC